jgi:chemotaxis protein MotB
LARYRSEFFGRLREVLGSRQDIRIVGDRFVFQSEVLFPSGSATLEESGKVQLAKLANTLLEIALRIPPEVNWIMRVDGHTDPRPISTPQFPSNWELSTARAISVVKFLVERGVPSDRLVAAGFGEYQPLDPSRSDDAFARNRRIEMKLDQR